ncbi:MAG: cell division protein FtsL [Candidatus Pelagibacter sp. TMED239]|nr:MAG: cell division protein FtsL [Candidatus Pelagibacter sp. TMED239]|tara:strand:+ start:44 stop:346 length:303 start_codon:yes stop_codon:yes gene_type:complete
MKKFGLILVIFLLILSTAIIKNSAKEIEDEIFTLKENLRILNSEFEKIKLEHDYLSSSEKLLEYQSSYFENELIQKDIQNIKIYKIKKKERIIQNLKIIK